LRGEHDDEAGDEHGDEHGDDPRRYTRRHGHGKQGRKEHGARTRVRCGDELHPSRLQVGAVYTELYSCA
jgi:hypothetical protein